MCAQIKQDAAFVIRKKGVFKTNWRLLLQHETGVFKTSERLLLSPPIINMYDTSKMFLLQIPLKNSANDAFEILAL